MIALYILGAIAAAVLLIASVPLTIVVTCHSKKGVFAKAGFPPFLYIPLYPTYEDVFSKEGLLDASDDEALAAYMTKILNTYLPKESTRRIKGKPIKETLDLAALAGRIFLKTADRWTIEIKRCRIVVGTEDAAETAYLYGGVSACVSYVLALIDRFTKKEPKTDKIKITADFEAKETTLDIRVQARVNLSKLAIQYVRILLKNHSKKIPSVPTQKG